MDDCNILTEDAACVPNECVYTISMFSSAVSTTYVTCRYIPCEEAVTINHVEPVLVSKLMEEMEGIDSCNLDLFRPS